MIKRHFIAAAALLACGTAVRAAPTYQVNVVLDTYYYSAIRTIDNHGDAVGDIDSNGPLPTYFYDGTAGEFVPMRRGSNLWRDDIGGMNNHGVVALTHVDRSGLGPYTYEAQLFDSKTQQYVTLQKPSAQGATEAKSINDAGVVVGSAQYPAGSASPVTHATAWINGAPADLGALGSYSTASDVNAQGAVVGETGLANGTSSAFLYQGGQMVALGTLGGASSWARAVNDSNVVVGGSTTGTGLSPRTAFLYRNGVMTDLGAGADSEAFDINAAGTVVGVVNHRGFIYTGGKVTLLDQLLDPAAGWTVREANAINDMGQIGATVCDAGNVCVGAILNPVPEPATYGMLLAGLGLVGMAARRRADFAVS